MAEAVRPKKAKSKTTGKSQEKKQKHIESVRKAPDHAGLCDKASAPECPALPNGLDFIDIPLSLPSEVSSPEPPDLSQASSTALTQEDHVTDQEIGTSSSKTAESLPVSENTEKERTKNKDASEPQDIKEDQSLAQTKHRHNDWTLLESAAQISSVPALYPILPSPSMDAPQLSTMLSDSSELVVGASLQAVDSILSGPQLRDPAVLSLTEQEASAPSLVPVDVVEVQKPPRQRLYPELPRSLCSATVQAFTSKQLRLWEPGSWLENVEVHVAEFGGLAHQEGHELHEMLLNYWRCRKQLTQAQTELQAANSDCKSTQNRLWSFKDEQLTLQNVINYYSQHRLDECTRSHMVLDWMVREQQTPGLVSQQLQVALHELEQARRSGRELRFYKEKKEILNIALSQAYSEQLEFSPNGDRWSHVEPNPDSFRHNRQPSPESSLTDQTESYEFYSQENINDRESLG